MERGRRFRSPSHCILPQLNFASDVSSTSRTVLPALAVCSPYSPQACYGTGLAGSSIRSVEMKRGGRTRPRLCRCDCCVGHVEPQLHVCGSDSRPTQPVRAGTSWPDISPNHDSGSAGHSIPQVWRDGNGFDQVSSVGSRRCPALARGLP